MPALAGVRANKRCSRGQLTKCWVKSERAIDAKAEKARLLLAPPKEKKMQQNRVAPPARSVYVTTEIILIGGGQMFLPE